MKKIIILTLIILMLAGAVIGIDFYLKNLRGVWPAVNNPSTDISQLLPATSDVVSAPPAENMTKLPLKLPDGFIISVFAKNLGNARVIAFDRKGNLWLSRTKSAVISLIEIKDGLAVSQNDILRNLNNPHGLAFDPADPDLLYFAEEDKISRIRVYSEAQPEKIIDLPAGGRHVTRTLLFGPDGRLYVSIGSSCDVCREQDQRRAAIYSLNKDGSDFRLFASGLRNAVFLALSPVSGEIWVTEMGRDYLGDDLPPDEINIVRSGRDYGWPICYGQNAHDGNFDKNQYIHDPCTDKEPALIDLPAHSAPLGLTFIPASWPVEYRDNLLVAYHGSWNRSQPAGYKVVRFKLDRQGKVVGQADFISGWLTQDNQALGRPVDLIVGPDDALYLSDDKAGVIYQIKYQTSGSQQPGDGQDQNTVISNFVECLKAGWPVLESYPRQCRTADGRNFVEQLNQAPCLITGCSGQICSDEEVITTCEFRPEYACYKIALCQRQPDGRCGWTMTGELAECLAAAQQERNLIVE